MIEVRKCIDAAVEIGCPMVKISAPTIEGGSVADAAIGLSDWLGALAERATAVRIVLRNAGSFRTAAAMWKILDRLGNIVGCCLDVDSAAAAGESSAVAVPVLNSRIHLVQVGRMDAAERVVKRLRGIGYGGYILIAGGSERGGVARVDHCDVGMGAAAGGFRCGGGGGSGAKKNTRFIGGCFARRVQADD